MTEIQWDGDSSGNAGALISAYTREPNLLLSGRDQLLSLGFNIEAMSAIVWNTLSQVLENLTDPIAVVLTGSAKY